MNDFFVATKIEYRSKLWPIQVKSLTAQRVDFLCPKDDLNRDFSFDDKKSYKWIFEFYSDGLVKKIEIPLWIQGQVEDTTFGYFDVSESIVLEKELLLSTQFFKKV